MLEGRGTNAPKWDAASSAQVVLRRSVTGQHAGLRTYPAPAWLLPATLLGKEDGQKQEVSWSSAA